MVTRSCAAVVALCLALSGCSPQSTPAEKPAAAAAPATPPPASIQRFDLRGKVVAVDPARMRVTVDHEAIPGFMGAMTMPYQVKDASVLARLSPGDAITAKVVTGDGDYWLDQLVVTGK